MDWKQWLLKLLRGSGTLPPGDGPPSAPAIALAAHRGERFTNTMQQPTSGTRAPARGMEPGSDSSGSNTTGEGARATDQTSRSTSGLSLRDYQRIVRGAQRGGIAGAAQSAGEVLGAEYGPLGSYAGGIIGGAVGRTLRGLGHALGLGGHGSGDGSSPSYSRGATPAQPVYVEDAASRALLTELLSATRALQLRATGAGVDEAAAELSIQRLRAGAEGLHG